MDEVFLAVTSLSQEQATGCSLQTHNTEIRLKIQFCVLLRNSLFETLGDINDSKILLTLQLHLR